MSRSRLLLDPIALEVLHNNLRSIADETYIALMKSAYSVNIKERQDHSTCLMDARGRTVVLAERTQAIHLSSMQGHVGALLARFGANDIAEGDILISNDPYAAMGSHLPDINFAMPIFVSGRLIAFSCNIAHHADVGGMAAGSMASTVTEIYQEGLRIPVVKLFRRGQIDRDLFDLILLNVRVPEERRGDYYAQIAACRLGAQRFAKLAERHSVDQLEAAFDEIIDRTEKRLRGAIATIPPGDYAFEDVLDDDGMGSRDIPIRVQVGVRGDRIRFDFSGSARQVKGNINCPLLATKACVCYAMVALLDREIANNQGIMNAIEVVAEKGTVVNPVFPAPVAARTHTCQRVVDVVMGALAPALPQAVIAASNGANTTAIVSGIDPRRGRPYVLFETYGGGCGGRAFKDGKDGVQIHVPNAANTPVEILESEYPLLVEEYGWARDSGGAGKYRGGLGLRRVIRPLGHTCTFTGAGDRFYHRPWGLFGGRSGGLGSYTLADDAGGTTPLQPKPAPLDCRPDQRLIIESPGAGGYGDPRERDQARLAADWRSGKFTAEYMAQSYGLDRAALDRLPLDAAALDYVED
jgi:N-methylhydantoinase B